MPGVPAQIAVQPVTHVDQLLCHIDLERTWQRLIDTAKIDQDEVFARPGGVGISAANGR
jgi:hypothetical protein